MPDVCLSFQVHHPCRLKHYTVFDIDRIHSYEDSDANRQIIDEAAERCYLPANAIILDLIGRFGGDFKLAFSLSGTAIDQFSKYRPDVIESFQRLAETGAVEFFTETYNHSLAFLFTQKEFRQQVTQHWEKIEVIFGQTPRTLRNTEFIYRNDLAKEAEKMNFQVILAEGTDEILRGQSPNFAYRPAGCRKIVLLLRNYRLSHDMALRFGSVKENGRLLTADEFARRVHHIDTPGAVINIVTDYRAVGEHSGRDKGIFDFLADIPGEILKHPDFRFQTPAGAAASSTSALLLDVPEFVCRTDMGRELSVWTGNAMQRDALDALYGMEKAVHGCRDESFIRTWQMLQTSDYFSSMSTCGIAQGNLYDPSGAFASPYDAYINYMNILDDFSSSVRKCGSYRKKKVMRVGNV